MNITPRPSGRQQATPIIITTYSEGCCKVVYSRFAGLRFLVRRHGDQTRRMMEAGLLSLRDD